MKAENTSEALDTKQQSMVVISALTATGDINNLKAALNVGLDAGLTINEIKEALVQLYAYCGFPRSLNAITSFMAVINERKAKGIKDTEGKEASPIIPSDKYATGKMTLQKLTGREEKASAGANAFAPAIDTFLKEHLFADIFSRDVLNYYQQELATISALMSMTGVEAQLQAHISMGINVSLTELQLQQIISIIEKTINAQQAITAKKVLAKVVASK